MNDVRRYAVLICVVKAGKLLTERTARSRKITDPKNMIIEGTQGTARSHDSVGIRVTLFRMFQVPRRRRHSDISKVELL